MLTIISTFFRELEAQIRAIGELIRSIGVDISHFIYVFGSRSPPLYTVSLNGVDNLQHALRAQWSKDKEEKYVLQLPFRDIIVLPNQYLADYGWKKDDEISSNIDLRERILGRWTLLGSLTPMVPGDRTHSAVAFIKDFMTRNMPSYFGAVHDEIEFSLSKYIGTCPGWHPQAAYQLCIELNMQVFERVFVGLDLCRNEDWGAACKGYSISAIHTAATLMGYSWWQRPFIAPFIKEYKSLKRHILALHKHVEPILKLRLARIGDQSLEQNHPKDFLQWWIERAPEKNKADGYALTLALIQLNIAGIQSTGMVLMQALFDLASRPEYAEPLLDELQQVIRENGSDALSPHAIGKLVMMDSFLKESQRHVAQNLLSIYRKVMSPLTLKDGTIIPSRSYVAVPSMDPDAQPGSTKRTFDGFRWARLRAAPGNSEKFTTVASGIDSLEFGYGVHACPGRFFAMNTIKAMLVAILRRYELRMPPGEKIPSQRYNPILVLIPPKEQMVELRDRRC